MSRIYEVSLDHNSDPALFEDAFPMNDDCSMCSFVMVTVTSHNHVAQHIYIRTKLTWKHGWTVLPPRICMKCCLEVCYLVILVVISIFTESILLFS
jgi:hypothetical protein